MKKTFTLVIVFLMAICFLMLPTNTLAYFDSKIDPEIILNCKDDSTIDVFVELRGNCVVQEATNKGTNPVNSLELMKFDNKIRSLSLGAIYNEQRSVFSKFKDLIKLNSTDFLQYSANGFLCKTGLENIRKIAKYDEVKKIHYLAPLKYHRFVSRKYVNSEKIYREFKDKNGNLVDGSGVLTAVTDSGLDYTHQDYGSQKKPIGDKVVISRDFGQSDDDCQEIEGLTSHGTACAGIMAGDGPGNEKGVAPKAKIAAYKLSSPELNGSLSTLASFKSFESIIKDKVQVSNNSFGRIYGGSVGYEANLINNAVLAGCVFVASQANSGSPGRYLQYPGSTTGAPDYAISVGASDDTDYSLIIVADSPTEDIRGRKLLGNWGITGKVFKHYDQPLDVIDCGWGRPEDFEGLDVNGKIALIMRGPGAYLKNEFGPPLSFKDKNLNAAKAGALMTIIYNYEPNTLRANYLGTDKNAKLDPNLIPSYEMMRGDGDLLRKELHKGSNWKLGEINTKQNKLTITMTSPTNRGNIADFTSIGPTVDLKLKPDVSAPGVGIRTCYPAWTKIQYVDSFGGTSAAGPFVAGCAALMVQARPSWNPFEIKRALMNTATLLKRYDGENYIQLTAQGQGRVNVYDALKTDVLIQPPSALIVAENQVVNIADVPDEFSDNTKKRQLSSAITSSTLPLKFFNYSDKEIKKLEMSFELNTRYPEQINVEFTNSEIEIPRAKNPAKPGVSWVGVNIAFPSNIKGQLNDVIIFATDKATGKKLHVGVCIYTNRPVFNTYASDLELSKDVFTPNGDGENEELEIKYTLTNGSIQFIPGVDFLYTNFADTLSFYAVDSNTQKWVKIHESSSLELGFHSFKWDGKDEYGKYVLPDGEWFVHVVISNQTFDSKKGIIIFDDENSFFKSSFIVEKSPVPPLPTLYTYSLPIEPGVGQEFELAVYLKHAINLKSVQFSIDFSKAKEFVKYLGCDPGDFITQNENNMLTNFEYDEDKNVLFIDIQRPLDGVTGNGYLLKIRLFALDSNFFDVEFQNLRVTILDVNDPANSEKITNAFYKRAEVVILKQSFDKIDFNLDGKVDGKDLAIITSKLGTKKGDPEYLWRCDLNFDETIDFLDLAEFSKEYK